MSAAKKKKNKNVVKKKNNNSQNKKTNSQENEKENKVNEQQEIQENSGVAKKVSENNVTNSNEKENEVVDNNSDKENNIKNLNNNDNQKQEKINDNSKNVEKQNNSNTELIKKDEKKELITKTEPPEYVQQMIKNKKRKMHIFVCSVSLIILVILFSTIFAITNLNNTRIIREIFIKDIDVSNLTVDEAKNKLKEITQSELVPEINLKYNDYEISLTPEQIEFQYQIAEAVDKAYSIGRSESMLANNYKLIFTAILGDKVEIGYTYNEDLLNQFIDTINSEIPGVVVEPSYYIEEKKLIVESGTDGIQVKKEELKKNILNKIIERNYNEIVDDSFKQQLEIPVETAKAQAIDMDKIYSEIHKEPQDAYFETEPYKIYPDVDGVDLAISVEEAKQIINNEHKEEYTFDLNIKKASKTISDLGTEAFPYLISSFSTKYDASNVNRSTNLKIATQKINGKVLMPGEEFSYNQVVGKRTVEEGYKDAKIYENGQVVDGLAGGICQISSTLYNAVLLANLEITERRNHSYTTSYVAAGRDATVVWGTKDFKFKNSRNYPIKIEGSVSNGVAEFKIHGIQEEKEYEIRILPVTTASIPYKTSYIQDATLAPGHQIVSQSGHAGYKVTTYKEVRYNGEVISKEAISNDTYNPMQTIIRVGAGTPVPQQ